MIYKINNPFVSDVVTEINTDTKQVWHVYQHGVAPRDLSPYDSDWWQRELFRLGIPLDADLQVDEGL